MRLLTKARQHDEAARKARQAAGIVLIRCGNAGARNRLAYAAGLDTRMVALLIGMTPGSLTTDPD